MVTEQVWNCWGSLEYLTRNWIRTPDSLYRSTDTTLTTLSRPLNTKTSKEVYGDFLIDGHTNYKTTGQGGDKWEKNKESRSEIMRFVRKLLRVLGKF